MPTRNVFLSEQLDHFVATGVASGQFSDASEVVREALRLLEQRQVEDKAKLEWLHSALQDGIDQLDRCEGIAYSAIDELDRDIDRIKDEVFTESLANPAH